MTIKKKNCAPKRLSLTFRGPDGYREVGSLLVTTNRDRELDKFDPTRSSSHCDLDFA